MEGFSVALLCLCRAFACVHCAFAPRSLSCAFACVRSPLCLGRAFACACVRLFVSGARSALCLRLSVFGLSVSGALCLRHPPPLTVCLRRCSLPPCRSLWPLCLWPLPPLASSPPALSPVCFCSPLALRLRSVCLRLRSAALRSSPPPLLFTPCHRSSSPPLSPLPCYPTVSDVVLDLGIWELVFRSGFWTSFWDFLFYFM